MNTRRSVDPTDRRSSRKAAMPGSGRSGSDREKWLDSVQLNRLAQSFRTWSDAPQRDDVRLSRRRILIIFLLIRYTGAKLNEVLQLDPHRDVDLDNGFVWYGGRSRASGRHRRKVPISAKICEEIRSIMADPYFKSEVQPTLAADPGFVRRKFYERAEACGFAKQLGAPEVLRKSRAVELMQNDVPLPVVQMLLGHSTPNLTSAYVSFTEDEIQQVSRLFVEKEAGRRTSARNAFFGKVQALQKGDIQCRVELLTLGGRRVSTVITNDSLQRLGLKVGKLVTAEVKAPWVLLIKEGDKNRCSADNMFHGIVQSITRGEINTECIVRTDDGTEVCAIVSSESDRRLSVEAGEAVWVAFSSYAVVLRAE